MSNPGNSADQPFLGEAADVDTLVIGTAPSHSYVLLDAVMTQALGLAMFNAVTAQQNASAARNATVLTACMAMLSVPIADVAQSAAQASARAAASADKTAAPVAAKPDQPAAGQLGAASAQGDSSATPDSDGNTVDPRVIDAINQTQQAVLSPQVVRTSSAGKAYQLVAQSAAIAVQDATDALRGVSIIAATAASVAMTKFLTNGDPKYLLGLTAARDMMATATDDFAKVSVAAASAVREFPTG